MENSKAKLVSESFSRLLWIVHDQSYYLLWLQLFTYFLLHTDLTDCTAPAHNHEH